MPKATLGSWLEIAPPLGARSRPLREECRRVLLMHSPLLRFLMTMLADC